LAISASDSAHSTSPISEAVIAHDASHTTVLYVSIGKQQCCQEEQHDCG